jgi:hypothetical protein
MMGKNKKLKIELVTDTEVTPEIKPTHVTILFQGRTYVLSVGDTFHVTPKLSIEGDFVVPEVTGIDFPIKIVGIS